MVRIVIGDSWKLNPACAPGLTQLSERTARRLSTGAILDVFGVEIDGIDLARGLGETAIFEALDQLAVTVLRLATEPGSGGQVGLGHGAELALGLRGDQVGLTLVSLARPTRVLAPEMEVELPELAAATARAIEGLLADLTSLNPVLANSPFVRRLSTRAAALSRVAGAPPEAGLAPEAGPFPAASPRAATPGAPSIGLELFDAQRTGAYRRGADLYSLLGRARASLRDSRAGTVPLADGPGFLIATDLARAAADLLAAIGADEPSWDGAPIAAGAALKLDLRAGTLRVGSRALECRPAALARALLQGAIDYCRAVEMSNPAQGANPYLSELAETSVERLLHARELEGGDLYARTPGRLPGRRRTPSETPIGPGTLKRLRYRTAWQSVDLGERATSLTLTRTALVAIGPGRAGLVDARTGKLRGLLRGESAQPGGAGVLVTDRSRFVGYGLDARARLVRDTPGHDQPTLTTTAGRLLAGPLHQAATLCLFNRTLVAPVYDATGRFAWSFRPPQARRVAAGVLGDRVFVAADNGFLYALECADGQIAFRVRTGYAFQGPLALDRRAAASLGRRDGATWLAAVDPGSGRPLLGRPLGFRSAGAPAIWRSRLYVGGVSEGASVLAGFDLKGEQRFRTVLGPAAGVPALTFYRGRLYCGLRNGSATCLGPDGRILWSAPPCGLELDRPLAPVARRGVVVAAGDPLRALDADTGALLCELPATQGLSAIAVGRNLEVYAVDDDGVASAWKLATHLSVV